MDRPPGIPRTWKAQDGSQYPFRWAWSYKNEAGDVLGHVARFEQGPPNGLNGKEMIPFFKPERDGWKFKPGAAPEPRPLYGLDTLDRLGPLFAVEGEKCAAALHRLGLAAVSAPGGAQAPRKADWTPAFACVTAERPLVLWPDHDTPGRGYVVDVYRLAEAAGRAEAIRVVTTLPEGSPDGEGADAADWLVATLKAQALEWDGLSELPEGADVGALRERLLARLAPVLNDMPAAWLAEHPQATTPRPRAPHGELIPYVATERGIFAIGRRNGELSEQQLANFTACIIEELALDDGAEVSLTLALQGTCGGRALPAVRVSFEQF